MLPEVNLLPKYERSESVLYTVFIIGLVICILLFAMLGYLYFTKKGDLGASQERVTSLEEEKTLIETKINAQNVDEKSFLDQAIAYVERYEAPTSILVDEFITLLPEHGYLSTYSYDYESVTIETQFETITDASTYIDDLTNSAYLNGVVIDQLETFTLEQETEEEVQIEERYEIIPRYQVSYSMQVNHNSLAGEEENDETAISGE